jgi:hypothetical protein
VLPANPNKYRSTPLHSTTSEETDRTTVGTSVACAKPQRSWRWCCVSYRSLWTPVALGSCLGAVGLECVEWDGGLASQRHRDRSLNLCRLIHPTYARQAKLNLLPILYLVRVAKLIMRMLYVTEETSTSCHNLNSSHHQGTDTLPLDRENENDATQ